MSCQPSKQLKYTAFTQLMQTQTQLEAFILASMHVTASRVSVNTNIDSVTRTPLLNAPGF